MAVIEYVREEVSRQGHDTFSLDGIERVGWMLEAWSYAMIQAADGNPPNIAHVIELGKSIERHRNARGLRKVGVRVGSHVAPDCRELAGLLNRLFANYDAMTPLEFYKEFEHIHPFVDGNGRTGKVLLNWKNGTLNDPIFPPADLWGDPILNP